MIKERLGCKPLPLQLPIGSESDLGGRRPCKNERRSLANEDLGAKFDYVDIPTDLKKNQKI